MEDTIIGVNNTKIQNINVYGKIYKVVYLSFYYMAMDLLATDYTLDELPADEVFDIELFENYRLKFVNSTSNESIGD